MSRVIIIKTYFFDRKQCGVLDAVCMNDNNGKNTDFMETL